MLYIVPREKNGSNVGYLTLTLTAIISWPVGWMAHKSVGRSAHDRERWGLSTENWMKSYLAVRVL
jgi:hypothetical protein